MKVKPQMFVAAQGKTPKLKIYVKGGTIQDIVKEACPTIEVEVFDYDIEGIDITESNYYRDERGDCFKLIKFN